MQLSYQEKLSWLQLVRSDGVGPITFYKLLQRYGTAKQALYAISRSTSLSKKITIANLATIEEEILSVEKIQGTIIASCEPEYPEYLKALMDSSPLLTALGNIDLLEHVQQLAIVGARRASFSSYKFVQNLAVELAQIGIIIVSGLAMGIDTAAHNVIYHDLPTIAVIANGINVVYPEENRKLYHRIIDNGGLVITEFPYNERPKAHHFPQRNRIISGLSLGVLVAEAGLHSGSLITAKCALSQGREVLVVPGSPLDFRCKGSNQLLKDGATLVDSIDDILAALHMMRAPQNSLAKPCPVQDNDLKSSIIQKLSYHPCNLDELIALLPFDLPDILAALSELELDNKIIRGINNTIALKG